MQSCPEDKCNILEIPGETTAPTSTQLDRGSPEFTLEEDDGRAFIQAYEKKSLFCPGDRVRYREPDGHTIEGPYLVASVPSPGKYILCLADDKSVLAKEGEEIPEERLELVPGPEPGRS
ncbi:hypothetical protein BCR34DRAFT_670014 [Clohesyomyces aquaticus]|uniref:Uncharacterized protein n=1 Tax=Clohesyomyces aquaticus TaxID=1231657 RepID=A0A1Y1Y3Q1_9PLEO|nr:hypothetical protein BCR34DRAFT_670014 [Clohesyomyces aquaticus]